MFEWYAFTRLTSVSTSTSILNQFLIVKIIYVRALDGSFD